MQRDEPSQRAKRGQTSMLSNKRGCLRRTNVGLDLVSIVPWDWSMDDTCAIKQSSWNGLRVSCIKDRSEPARDCRNYNWWHKQEHTRTHAWTCRQAWKDVKKDKRAAQNKQGRHNIVRSKERYASSKPTSWICILTSGYIQTSHKRDKCNHISQWPWIPACISPWKAKSMART